VRIAFQGEPGAFSEAAALKWHADAEVQPCPAFEDVFEAVERGRATLGVLPIENSIGGTIHRNYDLLLAHELRIAGEVELPVVHALVALPGTRLDQVTQIFSHPQALAQCDRFLRSLRGVEVVATYDTAGSARLLGERQLTQAAAIASERAATLFGLEVLRASIQDFADNITRFLVLGRGGASQTSLQPENANKTTVVFSLPNEPGRSSRRSASSHCAASTSPSSSRDRSPDAPGNTSSTPTSPPACTSSGAAAPSRTSASSPRRCACSAATCRPRGRPHR
jgi:prephenate dehydratase